MISFGIVQAHGGTIAVDSNDPRPGTTFRVELPGLLGRTREICTAVKRTRNDTQMLVTRARALRPQVEDSSTRSDRPRTSRPPGDAF